MLAKSRLNSIENLMTQALIDLDISHEEFKTIVNEKEKDDQMNESIRNTKSSDELSENGRNIEENSGNTQITQICRIYKMGKFSKRTFRRNGIEVKDFDGIMWLNEKNKEEQLGHAHLVAITRRYSPEYRKHRYEFVDNPKK